jgi:membrane protein DedA with SNARE-associated domain
LGPFILLTAAGCAIWAAAFTLLGLLAGSNWSQLSNTTGGVLLALSVLVGVAWTVRKRHPAQSKPS